MFARVASAVARRPFMSQAQSPRSMRVVYGIIGTNVAVYGAFAYGATLCVYGGNADASNFQDYSTIRFMHQHFTSNWLNLERGRVWTLSTSSFAHQDAVHLGINMFMLHSFAEPLLLAMGAARFAGFYAASGVATAAGHLLYSRYVSPWLQGYNRYWAKDTSSLGASGCITAAMVVSAAMYPSARLLLFGLVPIPAAVAVRLSIFGHDLVGGFVAWDLYQATRTQQSQLSGQTRLIDHAGHLGGAVFGLLYFFTFRRSLVPKPWRRWD